MALTTTGSPGSYGRFKHTGREPIPIAVAGQAVGVASGGAASVTLAPNDSQKGVALTNIDLGYRVAPTSGSIQASDGTLTWGPFTVLLGGLQRYQFDPPLLFTKGATVTVTMADGSQAKDLMAWGFCEGASVI